MHLKLQENCIWMKYACHREQQQQRLQIFLKRASFFQLLGIYERWPCILGRQLGRKPCLVLLLPIFFLVFYERLRISFSVHTFGLPGKTSVRASSAHCHQGISDLKVMFLNNMDLESKQTFSLDYYNWMLILIHCNPRRLVFLVFLVQTVA